MESQVNQAFGVDQDILSLEQLNLDALPEGAISRVWLTLVHDGLGRPVQVPLLVARGRRSGPVFGITAAVHGNELNGIPVIHRLFERLDVTKVRGTIVGAVVVNIPAYLRRERRSPDGYDLNHWFPGLRAGHPTPVYAHRFTQRVLKHLDVLVDLHTASSGRWNSLYVRADMKNGQTASMARRLKPQIVVHSPPSDGTLRGVAAELDIPAITVEIGNPQRFQRDYVRRSLAGLRQILSDFGVLPKGRAPVEGPPPVICASSAWMHTQQGGLMTVHPDVAESVSKGQVLATIRSVFGSVVAEYRAPHDGIIIGKSVDPVAETGARIVHLGRAAAPGEFPTARPEQGKPS